MKNCEIERKFTIRAIPENLMDFPFTDIEQAYLCIRPTIRVRKDGDSYYLTYKNGAGMVHEEYNLPLTEESYQKLLKKCDGKVLTKRRYRIPYNGFTIELDMFSGDYQGLIFAEVEFDSVKDAESFILPDWFSEDVTMDKRYKNSYLAFAEENPFTSSYDRNDSPSL